MNASEFEEIPKKIDCTKNIFGSVYSSDLLPLEVKQYPQFFVANADNSEKPGTHWVAFYFIDDQHGEFFDSYGLPPHRYTKYFKDFLLQLNGLTIGTILKVYLQMFVDITVCLTFTTVAIMLR